MNSTAVTEFTTHTGTSWRLVGRSATRTTARGTRTYYELTEDPRIHRDHLGDRYELVVRDDDGFPMGLSTGYVR